MMRLSTTLAGLALGATLAVPAAAQSIRPGLWEITNKMESADGSMQAAMAEMQEELAQMDPAQRQAMEKMMAQQGVSLSATPGGGMRTKMCLTREMAARADLPVQTQGNCKHQRSPAAGGKFKFSFTCTNPQSSGEGEVSFKGDTAYTTKMTVRNAGDEPMTMEASARWLGADCGNIKPMAMPKAR